MLRATITVLIGLPLIGCRAAQPEPISPGSMQSATRSSDPRAGVVTPPTPFLAPAATRDDCVAEVGGGPRVHTFTGLDPELSAVAFSQPAVSFFAGPPHALAQDEVVLENDASRVGFSVSTRTPLWVSYRLFEVAEATETARPNVRFARDTRVGIDDRDHDSYTNSGYDRGHMAPSSPIGRCYGEDAQIGTFIVTNICPRGPGLNQRAWERFEHRESQDYASWFGQIWVTTGPIFDEAECEELTLDVRIPSAFYKIVVAETDGSWEALAIVMPNARTERSRIRECVTTVDEIEALTGIDFFADLPVEEEEGLELDTTPDNQWGLGYELRPSYPGAARPISKRQCS